MDSLTQIALGAACGEVVLGRKIGNRAMLWGAIGGTIPDLDVLGNAFMDEVGALAFHRGISHSFFFAFLAPLLFSFLVHRLYSSDLYRQKWWKGMISVFSVLFIGLVLFIVWYITKTANGGTPSYSGLTVVALGGGLFTYWLIKNYFNKDLEAVQASRRDWYSLFFWSIFTHPILDSCTAYGTQLFQPFWDYRVAFNNISVADPIYTIWFLIFLTVAGFLTRRSPKRRIYTWLAIGLSSAYLLFTFYHKWRIDAIFERTLVTEQIDYKRYMAAPTILNNVLWSCTAEGDTAYYQGMYSFWDKEETVKDIRVIPKNHELLDKYRGTREVNTLTWFSNDYYNVEQQDDGSLRYNDLRYGSMTVEDNDFVFYFILKEDENGVLEVTQPRERDVKEGTLSAFWERIKGK